MLGAAPDRGVAGVYPGWGTGGWLGGLYPVPTRPSQDPYLVISEAKGPTYGQMKVNIDCFMRFPRLGPERVQKGSRMSSQMTLQDRSPDGPQMTSDHPYPRPQISHSQNKGLFKVLLTVAG